MKRSRGFFDGNDDSDDGQTEYEPVLQIDNSVLFYGDVSQANIMKLLKALSAASNEALKRAHWPCDARIYLYIQSSGGDAFAGLSAMDHIRLNPIPIIAIADGFVASAATFMLLGAYERKALHNAKILIHQLTTGFWGKYSDLLDEMENSTELMGTIKTLYQNNTKLNAKQLRRLLKKELHMSAQQALVAGIVDDIW